MSGHIRQRIEQWAAFIRRTREFPRSALRPELPCSRDTFVEAGHFGSDLGLSIAVTSMDTTFISRGTDLAAGAFGYSGRVSLLGAS